MSDQGEKITERALAGIMRRYKDVYKDALKDVSTKFDDYSRKFKAKDALYRQRVEEGKMTEAEYKYWLRGQVFNGKQWRAKRDQIANALAQADQKGLDITNAARYAVIAENANYMSYAMEHDAQMDMGFQLYSRESVERLLKEQPQLLPPHKIRKAKDVAWYNRVVSNSITQGIIQGEAIDAIAKRIMNAAGNNLMTTVQRNARTAMTGAQNAGRIVAMHRAQDMGIRVKKRWMATFDARTRDAHGALDGQAQEIDQPFHSELGDIMFPGDPTAAPANVYNCRCTLTYVYPDYGFGSVARRDNVTGEDVGDMTYAEWKKSKEFIPSKEVIKALKKRGKGGIINLEEKQNRQRFKTTDEIEKHFVWTDEYGYTYHMIDADSWAEQSIEMQNRIANGMDDVIAMFPGKRRPLKVVFDATMARNEYGAYDPVDRIIRFNPSEVKTIGQDYATGVHEMAHHFDNVTGRKAEAIVKAAFKIIGLSRRPNDKMAVCMMTVGSYYDNRWKDSREVLASAIERHLTGRSDGFTEAVAAEFFKLGAL